MPTTPKKPETRQDQGVTVMDRKDQKTERPRKYRVILHNDDFTPMNFVAQLISQLFRKSESEAMRLTLEIHTKGAACCGVYTHEIAETKVAQVHLAARQNEHPLMASMEPED